MTVLNETIDVPRSPRECFAYIADFTTTEEWDSTAQRAIKLTGGPLGVGTRFLVTCAMPVGSVDLTYEVTRYEPDSLIELKGSCRLFDISDSIRFTPGIGGTRIDYRAEFLFPPGVAQLAKVGEAGLQRMGRASMRGMKAALEDAYEAPEASGSPTLSERLVVPALSRFTRLGYRRGKRHWNPMSAYAGDKHMVITGASDGLGYATAMELARRGAELTLVMRNPEKAQRVIDEITTETGNTRLHCEIADLSLLAQVDSLAARLQQQGRPVDVLINNAGALFNERGNTAEGIEQSLALLLLSPYRLTLALKPLLKKAESARVINVVSGGLYSQPLNHSRLQDPGSDYNGAVQYARAKRALLAVTEDWAQEWAQDDIVVNAMHPGWANTPGVESALPGFHRLMGRVLRSPEEGADTTVWLAVATEAGSVSGELWLDREPQPAHLLSRTEEREGEREALRKWLSQYDPEPDTGSSSKPATRKRR